MKNSYNLQPGDCFKTPDGKTWMIRDIEWRDPTPADGGWPGYTTYTCIETTETGPVVNGDTFIFRDTRGIRLYIQKPDLLDYGFDPIVTYVKRTK